MRVEDPTAEAEPMKQGGTVGPVSSEGIAIADLTKRFQRQGSDAAVTAVDSTDLAVSPGEMVVLLGPSGCGKTTLLRCVAGLETPDEGEIRLGDRQVFSSHRRVDVPTNKRDISMIFQSYSLWPHMTVNANVAYPLLSRKGARREDVRRAVADVLELVGLGDLGKEHPGTLSGGQQQRVALARALVTDPTVILFDEPLSNIDAQVRIGLRQEIRAMHLRVGFAGIYVTHDQEEALALGTRVAVLDGGRVVQVGTPQEIYETPATKYVAEFVGRANVYPCTMDAVAAREVVVDTPLGRIVSGSVGEQQWVTQGASGYVVIRPEDIRLVEADAVGAPNVVPARVLSVEFQGSRFVVSADVGENLVLLEIPRGGEPPIAGDDVALEFMQSRVRVVPK